MPQAFLSGKWNDLCRILLPNFCADAGFSIYSDWKASIEGEGGNPRKMMIYFIFEVQIVAINGEYW